MPFFTASGTVDLGQGPQAVTGQAWLDREWSSQPLAADQTGWDWFSLFLDDGRRVVAFRLRGDADYLSGTLVGADGQSTPLTGADIALMGSFAGGGGILR
ncbi:lipocalin family protein [Sulfitobacter sp. 1A12157]|uniref:lipocalin family protein n=1 Tax=Sulfitobacter sp. 1A12157 TaxID=3368594 RepID=UPI003747334F